MGYWVKKAFSKHKGSLTRIAKKRRGYSKKTGKIKTSWLKTQAKKGGKIGRKANLALRARRFKH